eukprot:CAMPEP_0168551192 /NCGR_PEP_ID=MMETSP0413-20121227/6037_1 /TAXON_ID=136452 /ORGANISM="Filamoeba nolandi, Strain NC-AS-23-1" /LENGTH=76 /DNA_ID=CAMNT_0008581693 /DNA_START=80 /DNA_END=310 /DNA_ORIENTATION=+
MADDEWEDEGLSAPKYICTAIVVKDYIPTTNAHLTLILDDLVYVFKKQTSVPGFWEGETKGVYGIFPSSHVKEVKE